MEVLASGQALTGGEAETLFSAMFDGGVPDLELGALMALLGQRVLSAQELSGIVAALSPRVFQLPAPDTRWRPVLLPAYGVVRRQPNLVPLLALSLRRMGVPVLVHSTLSAECSVGTAYLFRELGVMPCASLAQAQQALQEGQLAFVPTGALAPGLSELLALRVKLGGGAMARLLARVADPFGGTALRLVPVVLAQERALLQSLLSECTGTALLFESANGDPAVDAQCRPAIDLIREGVCQQLFDAELTPRCAHPLPAADDLHGTARWITGVLEGRIPMPAPIANQFACCLYGAGYAQDLNQAKAIAAMETGSLAAV